MAIKSVSLLEYTSGDVTTAESNNVLVDRKYITSEIYNASDWVSGYAYSVGALVHVNGKLYTCVQDHQSSTFATDVAASGDDKKWERTYPILRKYSGYADENSVITHNLGTTDLTVQVYRNDNIANNGDPVWVPIMMNYDFGDGSANPDPANKIKLYPGNNGGQFRVVIVAAK